MRRSKTLEKLKTGKTVRICALGHFIPDYVHMAARAGYDCIWLDLEHRPMEVREIQALLAQFHLADIDCMLRPPTREKACLYRYLEDGAAGLMIPHVSTAEEAQMLVNAVKFPPLGERGIDGSGMDNHFDLPQSPEAYAATANLETFLVVQIETPEALKNVDAIAAVAGVDGLFIGLGDLTLRLKLDKDSPSPDAAIERVAEAAVNAGKSWGLPTPSSEALKKYHRLGAQLLVYGSEYRALKQMLETSAAHFNALTEET